jgi:hypothetical protein
MFLTPLGRACGRGFTMMPMYFEVGKQVIAILYHAVKF